MKLLLQILPRLDHLSEKLISNFYFDYNASAPFAENVKNELAKGAFFSNPSAFYSSGKKSKSIIDGAKSYLQKTFQTSHEVVFHSGATEGINFVSKGCGAEHFLYVSTDHSAVRACADFMATQNCKTHEINVNQNGEIDFTQLENVLDQLKNKKILLNITWVNNETGVVADLVRVKNLKDKFGFMLHLDGAQAPGKIADFTKIPVEAEAITFSGHKFGALTGIGFSFLSKSLTLSPLIHGGGQQNNLRSGTENTLGIYSLQLALEELIQNFKPQELTEAKKLIETNLKQSLGEQIIITGEEAPRNLNTINLIFKKSTSDKLLVMFDLKKIELSAGSACSSGRLKPSHVLSKMGYGDLAHHGLRFSFSPYMKLADAKIYSEVILSVFKQA